MSGELLVMGSANNAIMTRDTTDANVSGKANATPYGGATAQELAPRQQDIASQRARPPECLEYGCLPSLRTDAACHAFGCAVAPPLPSPAFPCMACQACLACHEFMVGHACMAWHGMARIHSMVCIHGVPSVHAMHACDECMPCTKISTSIKQ